MIVADEMEADWGRVHVKQAPGDEVKYGNQDTDGSRSTRHFLIPMRQVGAAARMMLEAAAAKRWNVPVTEVKAVNHEVVHTASGPQAGLTANWRTMPPRQPVVEASKLQLKDPKDFRYIGKGKVSIVDLHDITTGKATYGADVRLPGMKYAVIARPPVVGGKLVSFDANGRDEGSRRGEGDGGAGLALALEVPAARRRRGHRAQYRCRDHGARCAEGRVG